MTYLALAAGGYAVLVVALYLAQRALLYRPDGTVPRLQPELAARRQAPRCLAHHVDQDLAPDSVRPTDTPYEDSIR